MISSLLKVTPNLNDSPIIISRAGDLLLLLIISSLALCCGIRVRASDANPAPKELGQSPAAASDQKAACFEFRASEELLGWRRRRMGVAQNLRDSQIRSIESEREENGLVGGRPGLDAIKRNY